MWNEYTKATEAVAVQSTIGRLKSCFSSTDTAVRIGLVRYGQHDKEPDPKFTDSFSEGEPPPLRLNPWYASQFLKRMDFEFESEVRAVIHVPSNPTPITHGYSLEIGTDGLRTLIQSVRIKPHAQKWFKQTMESVNEHFGLQGVPVAYSELDSTPN